MSTPINLEKSIVNLGYASYRGRRIEKPSHAVSAVDVYLGIPYAEPPLGPLRFRKPVPLDTEKLSLSSKGLILDATQYPAFAVQAATKTDGSDAGGAGSEDSLKVDVYCPAHSSPESKLPVLVYIHGGGYKYGAPKNWPFHSWIERNPNIIVVSVYYRLSVLGFLAHPDFSPSDSSIADNNCGLHDQLEALRWIKAHIKSFGGDPTKMSWHHVTICGQSAGGSSVELLLTSPPGRRENLFQGAIAQSVYRTPVFKTEEKKPVFEELVRHLGCQSTNLAGQVAWLRSVNAIELMQAADTIATMPKTILWSWKPVVDRDIIPDYPTNLITNGRFADVPLIVGSTTDEGEAGATLQLAFANQFPGVTPNDFKEIADLYHLMPDRAIGDVMFRTAGPLTAKHFKHTYLYRFNESVDADGLVRHSADNYLLFDGTRTGPNAAVAFNELTPSQKALSEELMDYIVSFVRSGSPNDHKLARSPDWPLYRGSNVRLVVGPGQKGEPVISGCHQEPVPASESALYDFWLGKVEQTQN
ncbi:hypothetical protein FRB96_004083 [Tulasnella sp. 330]|nr:hypothetical protein FRB96_004083 [Tulasnella sp. 330]KAG8874989.1 hypothetical protein FRB97_005496 [Tulasnella sp. 331]KAG8879869.1 hypothetical protein FRB98_005478 [Tulasnella sp. 332]